MKAGKALRIADVHNYVIKDESRRITYEATVLDFEDHSELARIVADFSSSNCSMVAMGSPEWFLVHSALSSAGLLRGSVPEEESCNEDLR